jgi:hypothetical protein
MEPQTKQPTTKDPPNGGGPGPGAKRVGINAGDVVWTPDGQEQWHSAAPDHFMIHLSLTPAAPTWGEYARDDEYQPSGGPSCTWSAP